jgi:hypothetical protein
MTIRLSILEISNPYSILKESFTRTLSFIILESSFILKPRSFVKPYKGLINFLLPLRYLLIGILSTKPIEHSIFKLSFISYLISRKVEFTITVHFVIFPLALI